jgi:pSer/pThr/pTyr-binding forkhead associated (FHA) protein
LKDEKTKKIETFSGDLWKGLEEQGYALKLKQDKAILNTIRLKPGENLIGRMPENDIMIDDPEVSRSHARVLFSPEKNMIVVEDMQSENGIFVNNSKVEKKELKVGDQIRIGGHYLILEKADQFSTQAVLEEQIAKAGAQQWRLEQTVAATTAEQQRDIIDKMSRSREDTYGTVVVKDEAEHKRIVEKIESSAQRKVDTKKTEVRTEIKNQFSITLNLGPKSITKLLSFDYARPVDPVKEKNLEDAVYINVKIGEVILGKKIKL